MSSRSTGCRCLNVTRIPKEDGVARVIEFEFPKPLLILNLRISDISRFIHYIHISTSIYVALRALALLRCASRGPCPPGPASSSACPASRPQPAALGKAADPHFPISISHMCIIIHIYIIVKPYIYALMSRVDTPPQWYGPGGAGQPRETPTHNHHRSTGGRKQPPTQSHHRSTGTGVRRCSR